MEEAPSHDGPTIQNDPRFAKYFKMVKMGVPDPVVRQKMQFEGFDPSLLGFFFLSFFLSFFFFLFSFLFSFSFSCFFLFLFLFLFFFFFSKFEVSFLSPKFLLL